VSIGEALAEARHRAGLTVTQVSNQTHIRETIITGVEGDDYAGCGGDYYTREYIRSIALAVGADPEPLVREYDTALLEPSRVMNDLTQPFPPISKPASPIRRRKRHHMPEALGLALVVIASFAALYFLPGSHPATSAASPDRVHPATYQPSLAPPPKTSAPVAIPTRTLTPASAQAFGPGGIGQGDNGLSAPSAIDHNPSTAWHTDWYTTSHFGNLVPGTGLLLDMGRAVTIEQAWIRLGAAPGASFQLRVGKSAASLADLRVVARETGAAGWISVRFSKLVRAHYVLIWFTKLPPDPLGTFQASVFNVRLRGWP
jgi:cytoskeletal protein RodZ